MANEMSKLVLPVAFYTAVVVWKSFLSLRTLLRLRSYSMLPPEYFSGSMDLPTLHKLRTETKNETVDKLQEAFVDLGLRVGQLIWKYHSHLWVWTESFSSSKTLRAVWFSAADELLVKSVFVMRASIMAIVNGLPPIPVVLTGLRQTLRSTAEAATTAYVLGFLFDRFPPNGILISAVVYDLVRVAVQAVVIKLNQKHVLGPLPLNDARTSIQRLVTFVGYPLSKIYVDYRTAEPVAKYYSAFGYNMITVSPELLMTLQPDEASSVVAHELGRWHYLHSLYDHSFNFLCLLIKTFVLIRTYGNDTITQTFTLDSEAHPTIPQFVALYFLWEPMYQVARSVNNVFKAQSYFVRDDFAREKWTSKSLKDALIKLSHWSLIYLPFFDGIHSAWCYGSPTSIERIARIQRKTNPASGRAGYPATSSPIPE